MSQILSTYNIVDVLTAFDVEKILGYQKPGKQLSQDPTRPTLLPSNGYDEVYMITTDRNVISGQAGSNLSMRVEVNDIVRWRTVSLTDVADYQCFIHTFKFLSVASPNDPPLSQPTFEHTYPSEPDPAPGWPNNGVKERPGSDFYWQATARSQGSATYTFVVAMYQRNGELVGYFQWDPSITIRN
ncbi:inclusion body family protein [Burkholderia arboris]|uniref:AidA/PixA family protein n=1 Tax=Burkholderia arboris TaxID=488730 RepID=UPI001CF43372|nr:AidA/PixA family protein [Burkholderia arboris]MCA8032413.1 inclusion body family protein [Burkholderia arboris]